MDIKNSLENVFSNFKAKLELEKSKLSEINFFLNNTIKLSFEKIKKSLKEDFNINSYYQLSDNSLEFHILEDKNLFLPLFVYKIKIEDENNLTVYTINDDPDINAFKPRDIFGDIQTLNIFFTYGTRYYK